MIKNQKISESRTLIGRKGNRRKDQRRHLPRRGVINFKTSSEESVTRSTQRKGKRGLSLGVE